MLQPVHGCSFRARSVVATALDGATTQRTARGWSSQGAVWHDSDESMNVSASESRKLRAATPASDASVPRWILLIHAIPPRPGYLRVKVGRRLQKVGAIAVKNSVYVL